MTPGDHISGGQVLCTGLTASPPIGTALNTGEYADQYVSQFHAFSTSKKNGRNQSPIANRNASCGSSKGASAKISKIDIS
jgi:hypothetical protein